MSEIFIEQLLQKNIVDAVTSLLKIVITESCQCIIICIIGSSYILNLPKHVAAQDGFANKDIKHRKDSDKSFWNTCCSDESGC